jgi:hypothetical protein
VSNRLEPGYDKMGQVRWLVDEVREACMRNFSLGKYITMDETMICYKGSYCQARQYMPNKPCKWGVKVWCVADSSSKYVYNFEIYCGAHNGGDVLARRGEGNLARNVVVNLMDGLHGKGHVLITNNYFSSVGLLKELAEWEIFATGTMRNWDWSIQGTLKWRMHSSGGMACCV